MANVEHLDCISAGPLNLTGVPPLGFRVILVGRLITVIFVIADPTKHADRLLLGIIAIRLEKGAEYDRST